MLNNSTSIIRMNYAMHDFCMLLIGLLQPTTMSELNFFSLDSENRRYYFKTLCSKRPILLATLFADRPMFCPNWLFSFCWFIRLYLDFKTASIISIRLSDLQLWRCVLKTFQLWYIATYTFFTERRACAVMWEYWNKVK